MHLRDVIALHLTDVAVLCHAAAAEGVDDESCAVLRLVDDTRLCSAARNSGRLGAVWADSS